MSIIIINFIFLNIIIIIIIIIIITALIISYSCFPHFIFKQNRRLARGTAWDMWSGYCRWFWNLTGLLGQSTNLST